MYVKQGASRSPRRGRRQVTGGVASRVPGPPCAKTIETDNDELLLPLQERLTAKEAMAHPYFGPVRQRNGVSS